MTPFAQPSRRTILQLAGASAIGAALPLTGGTPANATGGRHSALRGRSIQVDPLFAYYKGRSVDSIAEEIQLAGYNIVHYTIVDEAGVDNALVKAFRERGIAVWALVFGNGTYSTAGLPAAWPEWKMELLDPTIEVGFTYFSHFSKPYREWKRSVAAKLVADHPFDGYEMAESYFPGWKGLDSGIYGDVGPLARQAFQQRYGTAAPEFRDSASPLYYKRPENKALYQQWMDLRVDAVSTLVDDVVNGPGGVRATRPDILVASWTMAIDAGPESLALQREYQALDTASLVTKVRPDLHIFQTDWPDWTRSDLPPDYLRAYQPFTSALREVAPELPYGIQADIGSWHTAEHDSAWLAAFDTTTKQLGYATWTAYEYHIGGAMYADPPTPRTAERIDHRRVRIAFDKRIDEASAKLPDSFSIRGAKPARPDSVTVDGNRALVTWPELPGGSFDVDVRNVRDTPEFWLGNGHGHEANTVPAGARVRVRRS